MRSLTRRFRNIKKKNYNEKNHFVLRYSQKVLVCVLGLVSIVLVIVYLWTSEEYEGSKRQRMDHLFAIGYASKLYSAQLCYHSNYQRYATLTELHSEYPLFLSRSFWHTIRQNYEVGLEVAESSYKLHLKSLSDPPMSSMSISSDGVVRVKTKSPSMRSEDWQVLCDFTQDSEVRIQNVQMCEKRKEKEN